MPSMKKVRTPQKKIREASVEAYLCKRVKDLGGLATKNDASTYHGIPDRTVRLLGYMCDVECKRPKGGRLSGSQKMWKKMIDTAGTPWHLITSHAEVDGFIAWVQRKHALRQAVRNLDL